MLWFTECTVCFFVTPGVKWIVKWAVQSAGKDTGAVVSLRTGDCLQHYFQRWRRDNVFTSLLSSRRSFTQYLLFSTVSNSAWDVNGCCLLSQQAFVLTASLGGMAVSQHVQNVLSPWQQLFKRFSLPPCPGPRTTVLAHMLSSSLALGWINFLWVAGSAN